MKLIVFFSLLFLAVFILSIVGFFCYSQQSAYAAGFSVVGFAFEVVITMIGFDLLAMHQ